MSIIPNYVPSPYKTLNVQLTVKNASSALDFYNRAFEAEILSVFKDPEGVIRHAEIKIADTVIMLTEGPGPQGESGVTLQLYTGDCEGFFEGALNAGAELISPIEEKFYGDRAGMLKDPFGHVWVISTHMEDLTASELQERFQNHYS